MRPQAPRTPTQRPLIARQQPLSAVRCRGQQVEPEVGTSDMQADRVQLVEVHLKVETVSPLLIATAFSLTSRSTATTPTGRVTTIPCSQTLIFARRPTSCNMRTVRGPSLLTQTFPMRRPRRST